VTLAEQYRLIVMSLNAARSSRSTNMTAIPSNKLALAYTSTMSREMQTQMATHKMQHFSSKKREKSPVLDSLNDVY